MMSTAPRVLIIGAGLAGLACARRLTQSGIRCTVLEGSDDVGVIALKPFYPGALVRYAGQFHRMSDPLRRPQDIVQSLLSPIGSLADKFRMLGLGRDALEHRLCAKVGGPSRSTLDVLRAYGFSNAMQARFFLPFLREVFLEQALSTPGWIFEFV